MCGITGFVGVGSEEVLRRMGKTLLHRGPDDQGFFFQDPVGFAHTRLSILDVSPLGHQPMHSRRGNVVTVFNGEIYNFKELREGLQQKGIPFKGGSDTEVILALYDEYGEACFEKMEGMFAVALYDFEKKKLILARDRTGKKPLYWMRSKEGTIVFGSELKALMEHPLFQKEIDPVALRSYLFSDYVSTPRTIFSGVQKLMPATLQIFDAGKERVVRFWNPDVTLGEPISFTEAMQKLNSHLECAVASRMVSDVPVGVFLSGGLDSSTVAYYASRASASKIKTFSIGFDDREFDESGYAEQVATYLGTEHQNEIVRTKELLEFIPSLGEVLDEPVADASIVPMYFLSQHARRSVAVALGGDGGDELFAGYPTFQAEYVAELYGHMPESVRSLALGAVSWAQEGEGYMSLVFKAKKFLEDFDGELPKRHMRWLGTFNPARQEKLFIHGSGSDLFEPMRVWEKEILGTDPKNRLLALYLRTYLMDQVMVKVDRATMAHALEARAPFLDARLVDFALRLPYNFKIYRGKGKYILKRLMDSPGENGRRRLPTNVIWRAKHGFGIPLARWLREDLKDWSDQLLDESFSARFGFRYEEIERIKREHYERVRDNRKFLWNLITLALWSRRWL